MPPVGFELTISAGERPQTYALDRAATGNGTLLLLRTFHSSRSPIGDVKTGDSELHAVGRIFMDTTKDKSI